MQNIFRFEAMSTPCEVHIYTKAKEKAREAAKEILLATKALEKKYSYYANDSLLHLLNERKENVLDTQTKDILVHAKHFYDQTQTLFDISLATIKPLYNAPTLELFYTQREQLLPFVGCEHFSIKKNKLVFDNPFTKLDLGGFVKEYAVDKAADILRKRKIEAALINFGGDIYALGHKPNGEKFTIGIKDPKNPAKHLCFVELCNEAIATSAGYERNMTIEGVEFSHILSRQAMQREFASLSVLAPSALESGVYATSLNIDASLACVHKTIKIDTDSGVHYENFTR